MPKRGSYSHILSFQYLASAILIGLERQVWMNCTYTSRPNQMFSLSFTSIDKLQQLRHSIETSTLFQAAYDILYLLLNIPGFVIPALTTVLKPEVTTQINTALPYIIPVIQICITGDKFVLFRNQRFHWFFYNFRKSQQLGFDTIFFIKLTIENF